MGSSLRFLLPFSLLPILSISGPIYTHSITPNFTASYFLYIDSSGTFLVSPNGIFKASISNLKASTTKYYFSISHVASDAIVWTANRNNPISSSDKLSLTFQGLAITQSSNTASTIWSTPALNSTSSVSLLQLQDSGNLVLLDKNNESVWQSFDHPTDTILLGKRLPIGYRLCGSVNEDEDLSEGNYGLEVTASDAVLQWNGQNCWKLSLEYPGAYNDSNDPVSFLMINRTGLFLFGSDGSKTVFRFVLSHSDLRLAKLGSNGEFSVRDYENGNWVEEFRSPVDDCKIPSICPPIGLCSKGICSCPPNFHSDPGSSGTCTPSNASLSLASSAVEFCGATLANANSSVAYVKLGPGVDYFTNDLTGPARRGVSLSICQDLCSQNCSCLAIFHSSSLGCYLLENQLGSFMSVSTSRSDRLGYIKAIVASSPGSPDANTDDQTFPIAGLVLLPSSGFILLVIFIVLGLVYWRRSRLSETAPWKSGSADSASSDLETILIPGLPVRFTCKELEVATENFKTIIGSGGFGIVYKGTLPDRSLVAVKKINAIGVQGKKEFCAEIAIIGKIHHINLVKLKGFSAQRRQRFLVYEYMNRGSLDRALFGTDGPVLEWRQRFEIALGTARGLAYLHSGCEHKIIHCDVKPENILLNDNLQVKISDFGLSKLLGPEQSSFFTTLRGTRGYLAPEWITGSTISDKADVYSYGMVLLEIVRGKKNSLTQTQNHSTENDIGNANRPSSSSSGWDARPVYFPLLALEMHEKKRYLELADSRLQKRVTNEEVEKLVRVALCCLDKDPALRPTMANVVHMLEGVVPLSEPRVESLNFLRFYGRRFTEESAVGRSDGQNEFALFPARNIASTSSTTFESCNSLSNLPSDELSGPR